MKRLRIPMSPKSAGFSIPEDIYLAQITKIEKEDGKYGIQLKWSFKILKGKHKGVEMRAWSPFDARPKNKTGRWLKRLLGGMKFKTGKFDISILQGKKVRISIVHTDSVNDDGTPKCKVDEVFSLKKGKKDREEPEETDDDDDDEDGDDDEEEEDEDDDDDDDEEEDDDDDDDEDEDDEEEEEEKKSKKRNKKKSKKNKKGKKGGKKKKGKKSEDDDDDDEDELNW